MLLAALLALSPVGATEGRWVNAGTDNNGQTWWLDAETAPQQGTGGDGWFKVVPSPKSGSKLRDTLMHVSVRCGERQFAVLATVRHFKDGTSDDDQVPHAYEEAPPDSIAEWIVRLFCTKR